MACQQHLLVLGVFSPKAELYLACAHQEERRLRAGPKTWHFQASAVLLPQLYLRKRFAQRVVMMVPQGTSQCW